MASGPARRAAARPYNFRATGVFARQVALLVYLPGKSHCAALVVLEQSGNLLAEGLPPAAQDRADQPPYTQVDDGLAAVDWHVRHRPAVVPVHLRRRRPAPRIRHRHIRGAGDHQRVTAVRHIFDGQHPTAPKTPWL
jgi:hypothetical protein